MCTPHGLAARVVVTFLLFLCGSCNTSDRPNQPDGPECALSLDSIDFGRVEIGYPVDTTVVITNQGNRNLAGTLSTTSEHFLILGEPGFTIAPGDSESLVVRFHPEDTGIFQSTLSMSNELCPPVVSTGYGVLSCCDTDPDTLEFGPVSIGNQLDREFIIGNCGSRAIQGSIIENCDQFSFVYGGGPFNIAPDANRSVRIRFTPDEVGTFLCPVQISDTACPTVIFRGIGIDRCCSAFPSALGFDAVPVGSSLELDFVLSNCGNVPVPARVQLVDVAKQSCSAFEIISGSAGDTLRVGESAAFRVRFRPLNPGESECRLEFTESICAPVRMFGTGVAP